MSRRRLVDWKLGGAAVRGEKHRHCHRDTNNRPRMRVQQPAPMVTCHVGRRKGE